MRTAQLIFIGLIYSFSLFAQEDYPKAIPGLLDQLKKAREDTGRVSLLLKLGKCYAYKQGEAASDLDTASLFAREAAALSMRLQYMRGVGLSCIVLSQTGREKKDTGHSRPYADKAIELLGRFGSKMDLADAWKERSQYVDYSRSEMRTGKLYYLEKTVQMYKETGDSARYAEELVFLSEVTDSTNDIELSLEALRIFKKIGYKDLRHVLYLIGSQYSLRNKHVEAIRYMEMAVKLAEERDSSMQLCTIYNRMGRAYHDIGELTRAKEFYNKAIKVAEKHNDIYSIWLVMANTTSATEDRQDRLRYLTTMLKKYPVPKDNYEITVMMNCFLIDAYTSTGQIGVAAKYLAQSIAMFKKLPEGSWYAGPFYRIATKHYIAAGQYALAAKYLQLFDESNARRRYMGVYTVDLSDSHLYWATIDSAEGRFASALYHYKEYKRLQDTIMRDTKSSEFARVQVEFETMRKEKDLKLRERDILLLTRQSELQRAELRQAQMSRNVIVAGTVLLLMLLGLGYNRYRLKQRTNCELEAKQTMINEQNLALKKLIRDKDWLVKEIHHRVKNNLQVVMSLLNTQAAHLEEGAALAALKESRSRMQAIALLHQKLYQVENSGLIEMASYIQELVNNLKLSYCSMGGISFHVDVDRVLLDVSQATPVGLIINEAITNSIKYAFTGSGNVFVALKRSQDGVFLLSIADDGIGLPEAMSDNDNPDSLGMSLIDTLSQQLDGTLEIINLAGVTIRVTFREQWEKHTILYDPEKESVFEEYV